MGAMHFGGSGAGGLVLAQHAAPLRGDDAGGLLCQLCHCAGVWRVLWLGG